MQRVISTRSAQSMPAGTPAQQLSEQAAEALVTLVQSCYPSASVLFPESSLMSSPQHGLSGPFEVLQTQLQTRLAARQGLSSDSAAVGQLLARRHWRTQKEQQHDGECSDNHNSRTPPPPRVWEVVAQLSPPSQPRASFLPDAVVCIDGVEPTDVVQLVAPAIIAAVPDLTAKQTVGASAATHRGERQAPIYCRRKVDWDVWWREKRCALRGVDLLELSLPIDVQQRRERGLGTGTIEGGERSRQQPRETMLVSIANPSVTTADLHRQRNSERRGPLRTPFGYSLPCLQRALPVAVAQAVQLLRAWQRGRDDAQAQPCTSAFWVSAVGHLLDAPLTPFSAVCHVAREWEKSGKLTAAELEVLSGFTGETQSGSASALQSDAVRDRLLSSLLVASVQHSLAAAPVWETWNACNFFLPCEQFAGTTDTNLLAALHAQRDALVASPQSVLATLTRGSRHL